MPEPNQKCPICSNVINHARLEAIICDAIGYNNNKRFNPKDPIIITEKEIYCCYECYVAAVLKEE